MDGQSRGRRALHRDGVGGKGRKVFPGSLVSFGGLGLANARVTRENGTPRRGGAGARRGRASRARAHLRHRPRTRLLTGLAGGSRPPPRRPCLTTRGGSAARAGRRRFVQSRRVSCRVAPGKLFSPDAPDELAAGRWEIRRATGSPRARGTIPTAIPSSHSRAGPAARADPRGLAGASREASLGETGGGWERARSVAPAGSSENPSSPRGATSVHPRALGVPPSARSPTTPSRGARVRRAVRGCAPPRVRGAGGVPAVRARYSPSASKNLSPRHGQFRSDRSQRSGALAFGRRHTQLGVENSPRRELLRAVRDESEIRQISRRRSARKPKGGQKDDDPRRARERKVD